MLNNLNRPISQIKNIGASRQKVFHKLGVETFGDLVKYYPRAYQNRGNVKTLAQIKELLSDGIDGPFSVILTVASEPKVSLIRRGMSLLKFRAVDEQNGCEIIFFNQNFLKDIFHTGNIFRFWGKFAVNRGTLQLASPIAEACYDESKLLPIVPVYPLSTGLTQKIVQSSVNEALRAILPECVEYLPHKFFKEARLPTSAYALKNIHFPENEESLAIAKKRLVFDELFVASCALGMSGGRKRVLSNSKISDADISDFERALPFEFTFAQRRCVSEILSDMQSSYAMNRILTGDVGSGKTAVAAAAAYACLKNGGDCLFMVPTEILALQHFNDVGNLLSSLGYEVYLLTGSTTAASKRKICERLSSRQGVLVIGTHALLSEDVCPSYLKLVIIDEQHRFGAAQRALLADKSEGVSTLVMSATPIPRTLSLVMYGTLDISRIDELPAGRKPVDTFVVDERYRERVNGFIEKQVSEGHQVYVVCPAIEDREDKKEKIPGNEESSDILLFDDFDDDQQLPLKKATEYAENLKSNFPHLTVSLVHGKMKSYEREKIMASYCRGEIQVLVSTTVIEVGVNVPNATLMIVENAERFGLSQLHQLRGRVGRGDAKSYFILVSDAKGEKARERLLTIKKCRNGYDIAEADLRLRGPGDIFSANGITRQHGESSLTLAANCTDLELISSASHIAEQILAEDPLLEKDEHYHIRKLCERFMENTAGYMN